MAPIFEYKHFDKGACAIGGYFLDGLNVYLLGDYFGKIRLLEESDNGWEEIHIQKAPSVLSFGLDHNTGDLYLGGWEHIYRVMLLEEEIKKYPWVVLCRTTMPDGTTNSSGC